MDVRDINRLVKQQKEIVRYVETSALENPDDPYKVFECAATAVLYPEADEGCWVGVGICSVETCGADCG